MASSDPYGIGSRIQTQAGQTGSLVTQRFAQASDYASAAWSQTQTFLTALGVLAAEAAMPDAEVTYDYQAVNLTTDLESKRPEAPTAADLSLGSITLPVIGSLEDLPSITVPTLPSLNAVAPVITFPDAPSAVLPTDPGDAPDVSVIDIPLKPVYTLPTVPTIESFTIPALPSITLPSFEGSMPTSSLIAPDALFVFNEPVYNSDTLDAIKVKLLDRLENGGTGLGAEVEALIWARALDRQAIENEAKYREAETYFSSRGWRLPPGALAGRVLEIAEVIIQQNTNINSDIAVKQADLANENERFTLTAIIQLEQLLTQYANQVAQREYEAAKTAVDTAVLVFNAKVAKYNVELEAYKTAAAVYESRIRASLLELEAYKAQIEGIKIASEIQVVYVEIYKAQLAGIESMVNVYKTEMEAATIRLQADKVRLEGYQSKVQAYIARVNAKTSEYNLYQAEIAGESAKAQIYTEQVKAFAVEVEARKTEEAFNKLAFDRAITVNEHKLKMYLGDVERYKADITKEAARLDAVAKVYGHKIEGYKADATVAEVDLNTQIKDFEMRIQQAKNQCDLILKEAEISIENARQYHAIQVEALKAGSAVSAQITASALNSVHASASLGYSAGSSESSNEAMSFDLTRGTPNVSYQHVWDETK